MEEKRENKKVRFHTTHIDVEWTHEDKKENGKNRDLRNNYICCSVLIRKKKTIQIKSGNTRYKYGKKSYERENIWKYTRCLNSSKKCVGKKYSKKSPKESRNDTSESRKSHKRKCYFWWPEKVFILCIFKYFVHAVDRL